MIAGLHIHSATNARFQFRVRFYCDALMKSTMINGWNFVQLLSIKNSVQEFVTWIFPMENAEEV